MFFCITFRSASARQSSSIGVTEARYLAYPEQAIGPSDNPQYDSVPRRAMFRAITATMLVPFWFTLRFATKTIA